MEELFMKLHDGAEQHGGTIHETSRRSGATWRNYS